ncbi:Eukaryotic DNA topoisomerase I, catalytic core [Pigmentiphaga humi]|uniref:DNA topoisomerase n=1 Tax=Pigmentiphaga humi TaxID=2478468 RepID=A0A3P4B6U1_9BURK|nr:DNA topoisomerase IB [Pigmentiphaga humi]VCU71388.1 Eukaryotic DNA topoisomerase I, catalytic core [Pigmentiphaga humi]
MDFNCNAAVLVPAPADAAAGGAPSLVYVDDAGPGYGRRLVRGRFVYVDLYGKRIRDPKEIARIDALAIPPAYAEVWICPDPAGHIQATGRDARGRKQYRYHPHWQAERDADKYAQLAEFGRALPRIRRRVQRALDAPGLGEEKVLGTLVRLLETTLVRVGNRAYARENRSFGLTTLRRRHASLSGVRLRLRFRGKSGVEHDVAIADRRVARVVRRCMEIPGQTLFHYLDEAGQPHGVDSAAVNAYLREAGQGDFTAKHYRTWAGSVMALECLRKMPCAQGQAARRAVAEVVKAVARRLANTPAVCRTCYIHPAIIEAYLRGELPAGSTPVAPRGLCAAERRLLAFLDSLGLDGK